ncbi:hypothetical protein GCM10027200_01500 [Lentzea nigeriaca]
MTVQATAAGAAMAGTPPVTITAATINAVVRRVMPPPLDSWERSQSSRHCNASHLRRQTPDVTGSRPNSRALYPGQRNSKSSGGPSYYSLRVEIRERSQMS